MWAVRCKSYDSITVKKVLDDNGHNKSQIITKYNEY